MSLQSDTNNDIFIIPSQSLIQFSGSEASPIVLYVEPSGAVNFVGTTGSILKIMDNLSGSLFSVNNISGLSILEVFSNNQVKIGNPANYALVVSGSNVIITGSLVDKSSGTKFLVVDTTTGVVHTTSSGGGGGSPTTPASPVNSIQYNNAGAFGAVATLTYDGTTLRATGSFTGSLTGSLFGTSSWAQSASQAISASYVNISSSNIATLEVSYATPGVIALLAKTGSGTTSPVGTVGQLQYNAGGSPAVFGAVTSSSFDAGQLTLGNLIATGSLLGTASFAISSSRAVSASFATSASLATTASYVNLVAGPRIQAINYSGSVISITGSIGGSNTQIQFNSGSAFSGSGRFTFDYTTNTARLTGSLIITGSAVVTGSFDATVNSNTFFNYGYNNSSIGANAAASLYVNTGTGISGSLLYAFTTNKGYQGTAGNPYIEGSSIILTSPTNQVLDASRVVKHMVGIITTALANGSFEWHISTGNTLGILSRRMTLSSTGLSLVGNIGVSGAGLGSVSATGTIAATGSITTSDALYIGPANTAGSWRIIRSGANLLIQVFQGGSYSGGITITPTG